VLLRHETLQQSLADPLPGRTGLGSAQPPAQVSVRPLLGGGGGL